MAHTFLTSSLVSKQVKQSLHAKGNLINLAEKKWSADFTQKKYVSGQTVTVEIAPQATISSGRVGTLQDRKPRSVTATLGQYNGVFDITSIQKQYDLDSENGCRQFMDTIAMRLVREMEVTGFQALAEGAGGAVGNPGTEPGSLRTWGEARAQITDQLGPMRNCYGAASPAAMVALTDSLKNAQNPQNVIGNQYLTGRMKEANGINFFESPSTYRHTAGTADNTTPLVDGTPANGASTLHIDGTTNGDIVANATYFTVGAVGASDAVYAVDPETKQNLPYLFKFPVKETSDASTGSGDVDITTIEMYDDTDPRQNMSQLPQDGAEITFDTEDEESAQCNVVFDRDAIALASVPLAKDESGGIKETFTNFEGVQIRTAIHPRDGINDTTIFRCDAVWAWFLPRYEHARIVWGA